MKFELADKVAFVVLLLFVLRFFDYLPWHEKVYPKTALYLYLIFELIRSFASYKPQRFYRTFFNNNVLLIIVSMVLSTFSCIFFWKQNAIECIKSILPMISILLIYYYFIITRPSEKFLINVFFVLTCVWTFIEWYQQITYPNYLFCGRLREDRTLEERMGLVRFYISGVHCAIFCLVFYLGKLQNSKNWRLSSFVPYLIALIGIIGFVSRKQIYASLLCSALLLINIRGKNKILIRCLLGVIGIAFVYLLFGSMQELNQQTIAELGDNDFIRNLSINHFLFVFSDKWYYYVLGTSIPPEGGRLFNQFQFLTEKYGFYVSDCGIIGYFVHFGIIGTLLFVALIIRVILKWKKLLLWHKLYLVYYLVMVYVAFWGNSNLGLLTFIIYIYLLERHLQTTSSKMLINTKNLRIG